MIRDMSMAAIVWQVSTALIAVVFAVPTFSWPALYVAVVLHLVAGLGITLGAHRAFSHPTFEGPRWLYRVLVVCYVVSFVSSSDGSARRNYRLDSLPMFAMHRS